MEKHEPQNEVIISKAEIAEFAQSSYKYESGTKKAVDEGLMSMRELEIYHFINAWTNRNVPFIEGGHREEHDKVYYATLENAFLKSMQEYSISEKEAREIHERVRCIPRALPRN